MTQFRPNLAGKLDFEALDFDRFEYIADYKYDGVRAMVIDGQLVSRSLKPIPNKFTQALFGRSILNGLDGELLVGTPNSPTVFRDSMSGVMTAEGEPDVLFMVFDDFSRPDEGYNKRWGKLHLRPSQWDDFWPIAISKPRHVNSGVELLAFENHALEQGYEGVMVRRLDRPYKFGRSTASIKDQGLLKLKRQATSEAVILGYECKYENANEATINALGYTERSHHKDNKIAKDTLGRLHVQDLETGVKFSVGIFKGWTQPELDAIWERRESLIGRIISYDHFPVGAYDKPRFPVVKGLRDPLDM